MSRRFLQLALISAIAYGFALETGSNYRKIHFDAFVVDTHNDVVQRMMAGEDISVRTQHGHSDLPRFREGGLDVEMFSIWVPPEKTALPYYDQADDQIDTVKSFIQRNKSQVGLALTSADVVKLVNTGKFVAMLGMEGGHPIANSLKNLERFYRRGVRYMTLTWNNSTDWATSAKDETDSNANLQHKGLTNFGKQVVRRMNALGMMVDVSHVGEQTFWDVMKVSKKPVIASHSSAWTLCHHRRNLKDTQLDAIKDNGGVVFVNFAPQFIDSTFTAKEKIMRDRNKARIDSFSAAFRVNDDFLRDQAIAEFLKNEYRPIRPKLKILIDHFDYIAKRIGVDHVGIGSDFDGIAVTPRDMDDVTFLPNITRELLKRGYSEEDVRKILGGNFLRVLQEVEKK
ncbi:MAG: membrane dipeptidase [Ignavibacteria bacterium]|nr:membrane dipeptidase [Ignavibacteria bacterium]MBI3765765.1 membrane dipeptidase [Ignavibacteriales bacterium]